MKRTQVYIDVPTYQRAKAVAAASGQTVSEVIRTTLSAHLPHPKSTNSLELIAKLAEEFPTLPGTPRDLSFNLDHYVYGTPKKKRQTRKRRRK